MLGGDNIISLAVLTEARCCEVFNYEEIHKSSVTNTHFILRLALKILTHVQSYSQHMVLRLTWVLVCFLEWEWQVVPTGGCDGCDYLQLLVSQED